MQITGRVENPMRVKDLIEKLQALNDPNAVVTFILKGYNKRYGADFTIPASTDISKHYSGCSIYAHLAEGVSIQDRRSEDQKDRIV